MVFIVFALELYFMYPWSVVVREVVEHSHLIFRGMVIFVSIRIVGYVYALKKGAFDWKK